MKPNRFTGTARRQRGISLIEMLVGLVIGIVCVLIILQVLSIWEARKRTTSSGNDAQISGTLGLYTIDRDLRLGGYGFGVAAADVMGCSVNAYNSARSPAVFQFNLQPVTITKGADDGPDEIRALYGNSAFFVSSQPLTASDAETKTLKSREGFQPGDRLLVTGNSGTGVACALVEVTGLALADTTTLEHQAAKTYSTPTGPKTSTMNPAGGTGTTFTTGRVFNLGPSPVESVWRVNAVAGTLTRYNRMAQESASAVEVASDVVTLKAQYGVDADGNGEIASGEWTDAAPVDWTRVLAVRFAVLVRSRQYERATASGTPTPVTAAAPVWAAGAFVMKNVDGTSDSGSSVTNITGDEAVNNWRNYRYRVYESVVPLRNMIWGTAP
jgi:type IV pilus assembly protein PilW